MAAAAALSAAPAGLAGETAEPVPAQAPVWREDFNAMPAGWQTRTKPGAKPAVFTITRDEKTGESFLNMSATNGSAALVAKLDNINPDQSPVVRWRWRVSVFPEGADGRKPDKDDQAIGIYISAGSMFRQRSLAYRWETDTPVGAEGESSYAGGVVSVKWICLRNRESGAKTFVVEERNFVEDFRKAFGFVPDKAGISISCNSQYTGTTAEAQLDWIEILPAPAAGK